MTRLDDLRTMRDFIEREIEVELMTELQSIREHPALVRVCSLYGVGVDPILFGDRHHQITRARHAAAWLLYGQGMSMDQVARVLGYRSKGMVHHAIARVEGDPGMRALLRGLEVVA